MRNPRVFLFFIFVISLVLLLIDLSPFSYNKVTIPFFNQKLPSFDFSRMSLDIGIIKIKKNFSYKLGLDLQGGTRIVYKVDMSGVAKEERSSAFEAARNVIERRINFFGVGEPSIQTLKVADEYRIVVELPGISDVNQAMDLIGRTAELSFWEEGGTGVKAATPSALPAGINIVLGGHPAKTKLSGRDLSSAKVVFNPNSGAAEVQLEFNQDGTRMFSEITKRNVQKRVAIVLDDQIITAPVVNEPILTGNSVITRGAEGFPVSEAKSIVIALNAGALPAPLHSISQNTVGPSLGIASLKKSLFAGLVGFISLIIFMGFLYRKEGFLACVALLVYTTIVLFIFKAIPVTLTLSGIAGFILSVGMAVDANILIFERMKEELRRGMPHDTSIILGFSRAWSSIRDSNISSLITCVILFYFGSGIVRGFALTLGLGILVSMFSAIIVTKNLLKVFSK